LGLIRLSNQVRYRQAKGEEEEERKKQGNGIKEGVEKTGSACDKVRKERERGIESCFIGAHSCSPSK